MFSNIQLKICSRETLKHLVNMQCFGNIVLENLKKKEDNCKLETLGENEILHPQQFQRVSEQAWV